MSKAVKAVLNKAEAQSLRTAADGIDVAFPPDPLAAEFMRYDAAILETEAADALTLDTPLPVGAGGELVPTGDQIKCGGGNFIDMVERPDAVTAKASMDRLKLADEVHCVPLAVDTAETIQAKNSIEKMLAHQLAAAHKLAMTFAGQARELADYARTDTYGRVRDVDAAGASRAANSSARMMDAFQKGVLALHKLRTGGTQTVPSSTSTSAMVVRQSSQGVFAEGVPMKTDSKPYVPDWRKALKAANAAPRCGAKKRRKGTPCGSPAMANGRCRIHGGTSTGPRTPYGLERSRKSNWKHGQRSAEAIRQRKEGAALRREIKRIAELAMSLRVD